MRMLTGLAAILLLALPASADIVGKMAPNAEFLKSWNSKGEQSLADYKGRVVLLEIYSTW